MKTVTKSKSVKKSGLKRKPNSAKTSRTQAQPQPDIELIPAVLHLRKILVPIDFSDSSLKALRYALGFAEQFSAGIVLLHVVEPKLYPVDFLIVPPEMEEANVKLAHAAREKLSSMAAELREKHYLQADALVRQGNPAVEIAKVARSLDADLIVIATHGYTGLKHVYLGSVTEKITRHATCPVLVVREREHDFA